MSLPNAVIDALLASGCTAEQLAAAMKAANDEAGKSKAVKREKDAERQRKSRANRNASRNVTVTECDNPSPPCPPLDKETPPTPPKEINPPPIPPQPDTADAVVDCEQSPPVSPSELIEAWNLTAEKHGLPKVSKISDQRKAKIRTFLRNNTIEEIQQGLAAIERSRWLRGENDRGWKADFDFFLQPKSFTKLIEGSYDH